MGNGIIVNGYRWKDETFGGDLVQHWVHVYRVNGTMLSQHICHVLTDMPQEYGTGYKIVRKFGDKYLIETQETYKLETWWNIRHVIEKIVREDKVTNVDE